MKKNLCLFLLLALLVVLNSCAAGPNPLEKKPIPTARWDDKYSLAATLFTNC